MKLTADNNTGNTINSYHPGEIRIQEHTYVSHIIVSENELLADWMPASLENLSLTDFQPALDMHPEIILFGTGNKQRFPDISLLTAILQSGIAIEVMETNAACSTYNVLIGEYRKVVAALLVEPEGGFSAP